MVAPSDEQVIPTFVDPFGRVTSSTRHRVAGRTLAADDEAVGVVVSILVESPPLASVFKISSCDMPTTDSSFILATTSPTLAKGTIVQSISHHTNAPKIIPDCNSTQRTGYQSYMPGCPASP